MEDQNKELSQRVVNMAISRILDKAYEEMDSSRKEEMEEIINSGTDQEKKDFIKENIPDFEDLLGQEMVKVFEEIVEEIKK